MQWLASSFFLDSSSSSSSKFWSSKSRRALEWSTYWAVLRSEIFRHLRRRGGWKRNRKGIDETSHSQLWFRSKKIFKIQNSYFAYLWTNEHQKSYSGLSVKKEKLERSDVKVRKSQKVFFSWNSIAPKANNFFEGFLALPTKWIKWNTHTFLYKFPPNLANYLFVFLLLDPF